MALIPTILCGGVGSRLWPVSRDAHPKPFIRLADGQSFLQKAFLRGARLPDVAEILTVTHRDLFFKTRDEYREVNEGGTKTSYILEPFGRGTAAAVGCAALEVQAAHGDDALLLVLPADHLIADEAAFAKAVIEAEALAKKGRLVTFGIRPDAPETGYGYIEARGTDVVRFIEKPSEENARAFIASGNFFWNAGMFCFAAGTMLAEMQKHCPEILQGARATLRASSRPAVDRSAPLELDGAAFAKVPDTSIDYALMEKSGCVSVVPSSMGWRDVGSWTAMSELVPEDANRNRLEAETYLHDVENCYIRAEGRVVGAVGVENLVIIDTADALLVAHKTRVQEVRRIHAQLKEKGHEASKVHRTVHRPWGTYTVLETGASFKIKCIEVNPGASLSLQMHRHRSEHWVVVAGVANVVNGDREFTIRENESTYIPAGHKHRLANTGTEPLLIIEVQCGAYVGEDDIVRFDDVYGRVPAAAIAK